MTPTETGLEPLKVEIEAGKITPIAVTLKPQLGTFVAAAGQPGVHLFFDGIDKGELPVAVLIAKPGEKIAKADIIDFCRQRISAYKAPRDVYSVDEMPLGPSGKILKRTLREWAASGRLKRVS